MFYQYCASCGARTPVDTTMPRFCSHCAEPFIKTTQSSQTTQPTIQPSLPKPKPKSVFKKKQIAQSIENQEDIEDEIENEDDERGEGDEEEYIKVPEITENPFIFEETKPRKTRIGDLIGTASKTQNTEIINRPKPKKLSKKQFEEQWRKEAGSLRPKS